MCFLVCTDNCTIQIKGVAAEEGGAGAEVRAEAARKGGSESDSGSDEVREQNDGLSPTCAISVLLLVYHILAKLLAT